MIARLTGMLAAKSPTEALLDVHGVGYVLSIPLSTYETLGATGSPVTLLTYLHVREDILQLYGFATEAERESFRLLISVSGIGPRMAQGILSGIPVRELREHLAAGNLTALTAIPGIGRKLAERLVVELRDRVARIEFAPGTAPGAGDGQGEAKAEALLALTSLGYSRQAAETAVRAALAETDRQETTVEGLIKAALRRMTR